MPVKLTVLKGVHEGRQIPISVAEFAIGRDPTCQLRPASKDVHWQHCTVVTREDGVFLRDDAGRGTYLNQRMLVGGEMQLADGDLIRVGPLGFRVNLVPQIVLDLDEEDEEAAVKSQGPDTRAPRRGSGDTNVGVVAETAPAPQVTITPMRDSHEILCPL
jgi:predicted component of type VI protein secretion system